MSELPNGWKLVQIDSVTEVIAGGTPKSTIEEYYSDDHDNSIAWITPADLSKYKAHYISHGRRSITDLGYKSCSAKLMPKGTVLFSSRAPVGYVVIAENDISTNQGFKSFVPSSGVESKYLYYYLRSIKNLAESLATGTTFKELSGKVAKTLPFPLAPLAEQKRIVEKLDQVLAQVDTIKARLDGIPAILKRFRQSVLAAAVSGKLTEEWRGNTPFTAIKNIGSLITDIRYGTSKKCSEISGNTPVLRIPNIGDGKVSLDNLKYADFDEKELTNLALKEGDLLLIRSNGSVDLVGKLAVITIQSIHCLFAGYLIRLRLDRDLVNPRFVAFCLQSPSLRQIIELKAKSTSGVNNINTKEISSLEIPVPSLDEQTEIVRLVDQYFAFADAIEQQVKKAQQRVDKLTQSILAKAFKGELVPQEHTLDKNYEPADQLLKRIAAARAESEALAKAAKQAAKKTTKKAEKKG